MAFWVLQVSDASPLTDSKSNRHGVCRGMAPDVNLCAAMSADKVPGYHRKEIRYF